MLCDVCRTDMVGDVIPDTAKCPSCGFFKSSFPVLINQMETVDEATRAVALKPLRSANFAQMLDEIQGLIPKGSTILDVGCAHGWFIDAANSRGYKAVGIEPDKEMAAVSQAAGHDVTLGYFPNDLPSDHKYGAIVFNDVFEHLPDVVGMANAIRSQLQPDGVAIINLPVSDGLIFRASRWVARLGIRGPYERMWQKGLPSPHLSYFSRNTLPRLMEKLGFKIVLRRDLQSIRLAGLYGRVRADRKIGATKAVVICAAALALKVTGLIFPSDIRYFVFRLKADM